MMRQVDFADLHNISIDSVGVFVMNNRHMEFIKGKGENTRIDSRRLEYMYTSRKAAVHTAHELYYQIADRGIKDFHQAGVLSHLTGSTQESWASFLNSGLFMAGKDTITSVSRKQKIFQYIKAAHAILHVLERHNYKGVK